MPCITLRSIAFFVIENKNLQTRLDYSQNNSFKSFFEILFSVQKVIFSTCWIQGESLRHFLPTKEVFNLYDLLSFDLILF